ncbi:DNA polymerase III subunit delta' [Belnapia sp. T6]|uniref:DNA polymerase III subunit delta n=1 Tax=Belnapia mucosa TaxID=2804532 RepID=A0ABS1V804_9PROT|nr:DNA polymerase III subunit delta' [Belnapia mucosa]MBL6457803.1 DNA polymerase III subunit delta' [Belnapia mucosa]
MTPPEPRANPDLVGHDDAARTLEEAAHSGRLHHAWLIAGPRGVGKATLAYRFARWLLAGMPRSPAGTVPLFLPDSDPVFRRVAAGAHADLFTMAPNTGERGKKEVLRAEDARAALRFMAMTAAEGGWRAVVVEELERTEREVVPNILLKTLEEPPPRTVQLVVTNAPDRLLPTIRSRCRRLDLAPLPAPALEGLLGRWLPEMPGPERAGLAAIADGCPGRALLLAEGEGLALQGLVEEVLAGLPQLDPRRVQEIADRVTARRDAAALTTFFDLLRRAMAAGLRGAAREGRALRWAEGRSLAEWSTLWEKLGRLADETERLNLDRKQAVLSSLGMLAVR